jgi:4-amino-4-deoxy-L-arabinose transferase-like glycosyltransferase
VGADRTPGRDSRPVPVEPSATDFGNTFYAAAAQAGSQSWSAWFFGSLDANNFITVDKPPASLWVTGLSVRLFGMNSWAVLAPQALMGVASVAVLYFAVRRTFTNSGQGASAGLPAGCGSRMHTGGGIDVPLQQP